MQTQQKKYESEGQQTWHVMGNSPIQWPHQQMSAQRSVGRVYLCKQPQVTQLIVVPGKLLAAPSPVLQLVPCPAGKWYRAARDHTPVSQWAVGKSSFQILPIISSFLSKKERKKYNSPFFLSILFPSFIQGDTRMAPPQQWEICLLWDRCLGKHYFCQANLKFGALFSSFLWECECLSEVIWQPISPSHVEIH